MNTFGQLRPGVRAGAANQATFDSHGIKLIAFYNSYEEEPIWEIAFYTSVTTTLTEWFTQQAESGQNKLTAVRVCQKRRHFGISLEQPHFSDKSLDMVCTYGGWHLPHYFVKQCCAVYHSVFYSFSLRFFYSFAFSLLQFITQRLTCFFTTDNYKIP